MQAAHRVAKNTGILYARMAITMFISLYATRLVLAALGAEDFGLFNVVGGVIAMLGFLNASMAAATQRFMSFAQGEGDVEKVKVIFNMSTLVHAVIATLMVVVLEIAGYFFFNGVLNIAVDRIGAARIIYQFMVVSTFFTVLSVPYEAVITSHENMLLYAILGVIEAVLKLAIALYITYSAFDHLILYGLLMAALSIFLLIIRRIYCHHKYPECEIQIRKYYDKILLKDMSSFAGWSLLGSSSSMMSNYGQGIVLNIFFGSLINAAQGIANQVSGQLGVFATTLIKALNPMIDKSEGSGNRSLMLKASMTGSKVSFFLLLLLYIPFLLEMSYIFKIWLKEFPSYTIVFCQLLLVRNLIDQLVIPLSSSIAAVGNIKKFQIIISIGNFTPLIFSYFFFQMHYPPYLLYIMFLIYSMISAIITIFFAKIICGLSITVFFKNVIVRCGVVFFIALSFAYIPIYFIKPGIEQLFWVTIISTVLLCIMIWIVGLNDEEKEAVKEISGSLMARKKTLFLTFKQK